MLTVILYSAAKADWASAANETLTKRRARHYDGGDAVTLRLSL
jgi:hypothetical protein